MTSTFLISTSAQSNTAKKLSREPEPVSTLSFNVRGSGNRSFPRCSSVLSFQVQPRMSDTRIWRSLRAVRESVSLEARGLQTPTLLRGLRGVCRRGVCGHRGLRTPALLHLTPDLRTPALLYLTPGFADTHLTPRGLQGLADTHLTPRGLQTVSGFPWESARVWIPGNRWVSGFPSLSPAAMIRWFSRPGKCPGCHPSKAATVVEARPRSIFVELGRFDEKRGHFDFTVDVQLKTKERSVNYITDPTW
jgi:hypothetical protein